MTNLETILIHSFENQVKGKQSEANLDVRLAEEMNVFLRQQGDLQGLIKKAYRAYMDAEAPQAWVGALERKFKASYAKHS